MNVIDTPEGQRLIEQKIGRKSEQSRMRLRS